MDIIENSPILEVRNLKKNYDKLSVLKDISFSAYAGSVISFIGSSGSGKSTLLRCCNLLEIPQAGEIIFKGRLYLGLIKQILGSYLIKSRLLSLEPIYQWFSNHLIYGLICRFWIM